MMRAVKLLVKGKWTWGILMLSIHSGILRNFYVWLHLRFRCPRCSKKFDCEDFKSWIDERRKEWEDIGMRNMRTDGKLRCSYCGIDLDPDDPKEAEEITENFYHKPCGKKLRFKKLKARKSST